MTLILTNDDGVDAPGIAALKAIVDKAIPHDDSIIVAPSGQLSGCGHQVTTNRPILVDKRSSKEYAIGGTPADCARIGITQLCQNVNWVFSGINAGGNLGVDAYISGTVAGVREAAILGIRGIAISQYIKNSLKIDWDITSSYAAKALKVLLNHPIEVGSYWNVNLPHLERGESQPEVIFCQPSIDPISVKYRVEGDLYYYIGEYAQRDRQSGTDVDVCFSGNIAVTKLKLQ